MPYIKQDDRDRVGGYADTAVDKTEAVIKSERLNNAGELNYAVTMLCLSYFKRNGGRYQQINDIVGALEGCKLEFYRRVAAPYEDTKIKENGDVY